MCRHVGDDDLLGLLVEAVVNPQAALRIAGVTAILDVPLGREPAAVPVEIELVSAAGSVLSPIEDGDIGKRSAAIAETVAALGGKPQEASRRGLDILKQRLARAPMRVGGQDQPASEVFVAPVSKLRPVCRQLDLLIGIVTL